MCPGISYSTVHSLIFHSNGSVQENKLFQEFCYKKQAHFAYGFGDLSVASIDKETLTLKDHPEMEKYNYYKLLYSAITWDYEVITTFMKIHNIFATWEPFPEDHYDDQNNSSYQLKVGSYWCQEGLTFECCPPM